MHILDLELLRVIAKGPQRREEEQCFKSRLSNCFFYFFDTKSDMREQSSRRDGFFIKR